MHYMVVNADDLGLQYCLNDGIRVSHKEGVLTSASLRANGLAWNQAVQEIIPECPNLGVGAHLCLNEGECVADPKNVPLLADSGGRFRRTDIKAFLSFMLAGRNRRLRDEVRIELRAQIEKMLRHSISPDHANGHMHLHTIPWIFAIVAELAEEYRIPFIRIPQERFSPASLRYNIPGPLNVAHYVNLSRWTRTHRKLARMHGIAGNDAFLGLFHTNAMTERVVLSLLSSAKPKRITEMLLHPAIVGGAKERFISPTVAAHSLDPVRQAEVDAICSSRVKSELRLRGYTLVNYRHLASLQERRPA